MPRPPRKSSPHASSPLPSTSRHEYAQWTRVIHNLDNHYSSSLPGSPLFPSSWRTTSLLSALSDDDDVDELEEDVNDLQDDTSITPTLASERKRAKAEQVRRILGQQSSPTLSGPRLRPKSPDKPQMERWPLSMDEEQVPEVTLDIAVGSLAELLVRKKFQQAGRVLDTLDDSEQLVLEKVVRSTQSFLDKVLLSLAASQPYASAAKRRTRPATQWPDSMSLASALLPDESSIFKADAKLRRMFGENPTAPNDIDCRAKALARYTAPIQLDLYESLMPRIPLVRRKRERKSSSPAT